MPKTLIAVALLQVFKLSSIKQFKFFNSALRLKTFLAIQDPSRFHIHFRNNLLISSSKKKKMARILTVIALIPRIKSGRTGISKHQIFQCMNKVCLPFISVFLNSSQQCFTVFCVKVFCVFHYNYSYPL